MLRAWAPGGEDGARRTFFRHWFETRAGHPVLRTGEATLLAPHPDVLCVVRRVENGRDALGSPAEDAAAFLTVHRGSEPLTICLPEAALDGICLRDEAGEALAPSDGLYQLELAPCAARLWLWEGSGDSGGLG